jgi:hypothetical protein
VFFQKKFAIPPEKGGWVWWVGPLAIGVAAAGGVRPMLAAVVVGAFSAFCVRQPLTLFIKSFRLASHKPDRIPAGFWVFVYSLGCALAVLALAWGGQGRVVTLAGPAMPVFGWQFYLVARGSERRQMVRDVLAAFALSLAGTAAYWSCGGGDPTTAALVWLLPGLHASASIVHMFLRLEQRRWDSPGPMIHRLKRGAVPALHHILNMAVAVALYIDSMLASAGVAAFALCTVEGLWAIAVPQTGHTPKQLGMRQLAVSTAFAALVCMGYGLQARQG